MKVGKIAFIIFLQINCIASSLSAQDTLVINGRLTDSATKEPVLFGNVFLDKLGLITNTDLDGKFNFTIISDFSFIPTATVRAKYTGYPTSDSLILLRNYINIPSCNQQTLEITFESPSVDFQVVRPLSREALIRMEKNKHITKRKDRK